MSLEPIPTVQTSQAFLASQDLGELPQLKWIDVDNLRVDPSYQREIGRHGERNAVRIAKEFKWSHCSPLVVSDRGDGLHAVIDGQHRASAAKLHGGINKMPCLVVRCDVAEEAAAFAAINGQVTGLKALQVYHAELAAGNRRARKLKALCDRVGVLVPRNSQNCDRPGQTLAIGTLKSCLDSYGEEILERALQLIVGTGNGNAGLLTIGTIAGLCRAIKNHPSWGIRALKACVEAEGIGKLLDRARRIRELDGGSLTEAFEQILEKAYVRKEAA